MVPAPLSVVGPDPSCIGQGDPKATSVMGDVLHGDSARPETASAPITPLPSGPHLPVGRGRSLEQESVDINVRRGPEPIHPQGVTSGGDERRTPA